MLKPNYYLKTVNMTKEELIDAVMSIASIETKTQAKAAVEGVFDTITKTLSKGGEVAISGFGIFKVNKRAARAGINPKTGEKIQIAAKTVPKFRAGKALKDSVK